MEAKFNKRDISLITAKIYSYDSCNTQKKTIAIPSEDIFAYVFNEAKLGNEMAALQIHEWSKYCKPCNIREKCICHRIKEAAKKIFN